MSSQNPDSSFKKKSPSELLNFVSNPREKKGHFSFLVISLIVKKLKFLSDFKLIHQILVKIIYLDYYLKGKTVIKQKQYSPTLFFKFSK